MKTTYSKVVCGIIVIFLGIAIYAIASSKIKSSFVPNYDLDDFYIVPKKNMQINEYSVVKVQKEDMIKKYFNTFISMMFGETDYSYNFVNSEYKKIKFNNDIQIYRDFVVNITDNYQIYPKIKEYREETRDNLTIYEIKDTNNNIYIFAVEGTMKYSVYFDWKTVEIG